MKETIVVVANVNITAGAALLPSGFSTGEKPIVVASCIKWEAVFLFVEFCQVSAEPQDFELYRSHLFCFGLHRQGCLNRGDLNIDVDVSL